jgi:carbamoyl-phosphate synthase large subunit
MSYSELSILITSIGSMSFECVYDSLKKLSVSKIIGIDYNNQNYLQCSEIVDKFYQSPKVKDKSYLNFITEICEKEKINFIIILTDLEIDFFKDYLDFFLQKKITISVSDKLNLEKSRNKFVIYETFKDNKIVNVVKTERIRETTNVLFPSICKPVDGRSSENMFLVENKDDLKYVKKSKKYSNHILQPFIFGKNITVDICRKKNGEFFCSSRKEHIRTKNGAGVSVETFFDEKIVKIISEVLKKINLIGCFNIEFINLDGEYYMTDINPRFSAGISFSDKVGFNLVKNHLDIFMDIEFNFPNYLEKKFIYKKFCDYEKISN